MNPILLLQMMLPFLGKMISLIILCLLNKIQISLTVASMGKLTTIMETHFFLSTHSLMERGALIDMGPSIIAFAYDLDSPAMIWPFACTETTFLFPLSLYHVSLETIDLLLQHLAQSLNFENFSLFRLPISIFQKLFSILIIVRSI